MRVQLKFRWHVVFDRAFDVVDGFARCDPGAIAQPKDMRVDRLSGLFPPHIQNDIRGFPTNARQSLQGGAGRRDFAAVFLDQDPAEFDDVLGLLAKQADRFDMFDQALFAEVQHLLRRVGDLKQGFGRFVDPGIGCLRRKRDRNNQSIDIDVIKLALWFRFGVAKARKDLRDRVVIELLCHKTGMREQKARCNAHLPGRKPASPWGISSA